MPGALAPHAWPPRHSPRPRRPPVGVIEDDRHRGLAEHLLGHAAENHPHGALDGDISQAKLHGGEIVQMLGFQPRDFLIGVRDQVAVPAVLVVG